jgi:DNA-binding response OmpR family regulator
MTGFDEIKHAAERLSVLGVSNDAAVNALFDDLLAGLFKKAVIVGDAAEGAQKLRNGDTDVLIIDGTPTTPGGLKLLKEVRLTDRKLSIIMLVSREDADGVFDALSLGETQLLVKPVQVDNLLSVLDAALQRSIGERQKMLVRELTLTRQRERQRLIEEKISFFKALSTIRNDLYYRKLEVVSTEGETSEWLINIRYKPKDVLSGDSYSIRTVGVGRVLVFLIDAMSKGLSASFTAHLVTAFANYLIDRERDNFSFGPFVGEFQQFIRRNLHEEEPLSASLALMDLKKGVMDYALFSMPPLYLQTTQDEVLKLNGCAMPIMRGTREVELRQAPLQQCKKLLICSDGLLDPASDEHFEQDFAASSFRNMLYNRFIDRVGDIRDDLTMIFLRKLEGEVRWEKTYTIPALFDEVNRSIGEVEQMLTAREYRFEFVMEYINAYTEIIMNAYEHGSLHIGSALKNRLVKAGEYEDYLLKREREAGTKITITLKALVDNTNDIVVIKVRDGGKGFDTMIFRETIRNPEFVDGRGLKMARSLVDELYFNDVGNEAILIKVV